MLCSDLRLMSRNSPGFGTVIRIQLFPEAVQVPDQDFGREIYFSLGAIHDFFDLRLERPEVDPVRVLKSFLRESLCGPIRSSRSICIWGRKFPGPCV